MFYGSTAEIEAIAPDLVRKLRRVDVTEQEFVEVLPVVKHIRAVRNVTTHGDGEVCIPIMHGVISRIRTTFVDFFNGGKKTAR